MIALSLYILPLSRGRDLGSYQIILDKHLLGAPRRVTPPPAAPPPVKSTPGWSREYRLTMMTKDQSTGAVRIGLQNTRDNSALLLIEGKDRYKDYKLVSADPTGGSAQISYQGQVHRFDLQEGPVTSRSASPQPQNRSQVSQRSSTSEPSTPPRRRTVRRRIISPPRQEDTSAVQIKRFASQEELQEHLKEQQMDAIRSGKPPLPIPLTPEMDAQLVEEGVLPPLDTP